MAKRINSLFCPGLNLSTSFSIWLFILSFTTLTEAPLLFTFRDHLAANQHFSFSGIHYLPLRAMPNARVSALGRGSASKR